MLKFTNVKFIKFGYLLGGIYDILLGLGIIIIPDLLISFFQITKPYNMIFVYTSGLFLLVVGYYLLFAYFHDVTNFLFIGFGSSMVRLTFALIIFVLWMTEGIEFSYILIACTDIITGFMILLPIISNNGLSRKELWING